MFQETFPHSMLAPPQEQAAVHTDPTTGLHHECRKSLDTGTFIDTKFFVFSRRNQDAVIYAPGAVYAGSGVLRGAGCHYLEALLGGGFGGNTVTGLLNGDVPEGRTHLTEAESQVFESDSDIEDDDDTPTLASTHPTNMTVNCTEDDSWISEEDSSLDHCAAKIIQADMKPVTGNKNTMKVEEDNVSGPDYKGKIVVLSQFAYPTWKALVYYLYTGTISFAPLTSQLDAPGGSRRHATFGPPLCSPKSMYKLADELGMVGLKARAEADFRSKLSSRNITTELFSTFTLQFDRIRDIEIAFACTSARDVIRSALPAWLADTPAEEIKRHATTLGSLIQKLAENSTHIHQSSPPVYQTLGQWGAAPFEQQWP